VTNDLDLLRRHAPRLRFDSLECLRPTRVDDYVGRSMLRDGHGDPAHPEVTGLAKLDLPATALWCLDPMPNDRALDGEARSDALLEELGGGWDRNAPGTCYGRVVPTSTAVFLQYWFFYVDNPCVIAPGRHDGDWELVQLRLTAKDQKLTHVTAAQHGGPETRRLPPGTTRPEVFVAVGSHASYFGSGTQPKFPLSDECDGAQRPAAELDVTEMPQSGWSEWRGRWGMDRGPGTWLATRLRLHRTPPWLRWLNSLGAGDSPASPRWQHSSWGSPLAFQLRGSARKFTSVVLRQLLHFVGKLTWPRATPAIEVTRDGAGHVTATARRSGWGPRGVRHVAVKFEGTETGRPLGVHTVRTDGKPHRVALPATAAAAWQATGYNWLRQRGDVGGLQPLRDG
jgi:hypothetical protein